MAKPHLTINVQQYQASISALFGFRRLRCDSGDFGDLSETLKLPLCSHLPYI